MRLTRRAALAGGLAALLARPAAAAPPLTLLPPGMARMPAVSIVFSPDGRRLGLWTGGAVTVIDLVAPALAWRSQALGRSEFVGGLAFSGDSRTLAAVAGGSRWGVFDVGSGTMRHAPLAPHKATAVAAAADGSHFLVGTVAGTVLAWNYHESHETARVEAHQTGIRCLAVRGGEVFSGAFDQRVRRWTLPDLGDGTVLSAGLDGGRTHRGIINAMAVTAAGQLVTTSSWDGTGALTRSSMASRRITHGATVHWWNDAAGRPDRSVVIDFGVQSVAPLADGRLFAIQNDGTMLYGHPMVIPSRGTDVVPVSGLDDVRELVSVAVHPNGRLAVFGTYWGHVVLIDLERNRRLLTLAFGPAGMAAVAPDGTFGIDGAYEAIAVDAAGTARRHPVADVVSHALQGLCRPAGCVRP
jgi:WD40 repeat protein